MLVCRFTASRACDDDEAQVRVYLWVLRDDDVGGVGFADGEGDCDRADEGVRISVSYSRRGLEDSEGSDAS